jgi:hypothetical protein
MSRELRLEMLCFVARYALELYQFHFERRLLGSSKSTSAWQPQQNLSPAETCQRQLMSEHNERQDFRARTI